MSNSDKVTAEGVIVECLRGGQFKVDIPMGGRTIQIQAYLSGRMRKHDITIVPGDKVTIELSPHDLTKGRIVFRNR